MDPRTGAWADPRMDDGMEEPKMDATVDFRTTTWTDLGMMPETTPQPDLEADRAIPDTPKHYEQSPWHYSHPGPPPPAEPAMLPHPEREPAPVGAPQWRPPALRKRMLVPVAALSFGFAAVVIALVQISNRDRGLLFAPRIDEVSAGQTFAFRYLPTIIAALYGLLWTWIDLDAKRTEPYYQLMKPRGARAENSVLLQYPFDWFVQVPFVALKKKHWVVAMSSWAALAVVFITPLQAAMLAVNTIVIESSTSVLQSTSFVPEREQRGRILNIDITSSALAITFLNETLQPFTTKDYAIAPFRPSSNLSIPGPNGGSTLVTAPTKLYSVDLECEPYPWTDLLSDRSFVVFKPEDQCNISRELLVVQDVPVENNTVGQPRYIHSINITSKDEDFFRKGATVKPFEIQTVACSVGRRSLSFLAMFAQNRASDSDPPSKITRILCRPEYYVQDATATVDWQDKSLLRVEALGAKGTMPPTMFNQTAYAEWLLPGDYTDESRPEPPDPSEGPIDMDLIDYIEISGNKLLLRFGSPSDYGSWAGSQVDEDVFINPEMDMPETYLATCALQHMKSSLLSLKDLADPENLRVAYRAGLRVLFARAMASILQERQFSESATLEGTVGMEVEALQMIPPIAYAVVGLFIFNGVLACGLAVGMARRKQHLTADPAMIATVMSLAADDDETQNFFKDMDTSSEKHLIENLKGKEFEIKQQGGAMGLRLVETESEASEIKAKIWFQGIRPWEIHAGFVIPFFIFMIIALILIALLQHYTTPYGIPLPSPDLAVQQIVLQYVPTTFATIIEPLWTIITRAFCTLRPFEDLRSGRSQASRSILAAYSALPPQFAFWKAVSSLHFTLAIVSLMPLAANVLAVVLGGLFQTRNVLVPHTISTQLLFGERFRNVTDIYTRASENGAWIAPGESVGDLAIVLSSNLSAVTEMPPWADTKWFYTPFDLSDAGMRTNGGATEEMRIRARTRFYGLDMECSPLNFEGSDPDGWPVIDQWRSTDPFSRALTWTISADLQTPSGPISCAWDSIFVADIDNIVNASIPALCPRTGPSAVEWWAWNGTNIYYNADFNTANIDGFAGQLSAFSHPLCADYIVHVWGRYEGPDVCDAYTTAAQRARKPPDRFYPDTAEWREKEPAARKYTAIACRPVVLTGMADVTVDWEGKVISSEAKGEDATAAGEEFFPLGSGKDVGRGVIWELLRSEDKADVWHNDTYAAGWPDFIIAKLHGPVLVDPSLPAPEADLAMRYYREAWQRVGAIWFSVRYQAILERLPSTSAAASETALQATRFVRERRVFLSLVSFILAEIILAVFLLVTVLIYARRPGRFLPRVPLSIASLVPMFAASSILQDLRGTSGLDGRQLQDHVEAMGGRYGYGPYVGVDGEEHLGIEKNPVVRPLAMKRRYWAGALWSRWWPRRKAKPRRSGQRRGSEPAAREELPRPYDGT